MSGLVVRESLGERRFAAEDFPIAVGGTGSAIVMSGRPAAFQAGSEVPNGWEAQVTNTDAEPGTVTVNVICVAAPGVVTSDSPA